MPLTEYELWKVFFAFLKVEKVSKMHWKDFGPWGMVECMHNLVSITTKHMAQKASFKLSNEVVFLHNHER